MDTATQTQRREVGDIAQSRSIMPPVNITARDDEYVLEVEMPGVNRDGLQISVEGNELTILGRRSRDSNSQGETVYRESSDADYRRVFELSSDIDTNKVSAEMHQGILKLHLPKAERVK